MNHREEETQKEVKIVGLTISIVFGVGGILALSADVMSSLQQLILNKIQQLILNKIQQLILNKIPE